MDAISQALNIVSEANRNSVPQTPREKLAKIRQELKESADILEEAGAKLDALVKKLKGEQ